ncbi:MAG: Rid family hydrolase [Pseudomonadota bacterium]
MAGARFVASCLCAGALAACSNAPQTAEIRFISNPIYAEQGIPISDAVEADGWLFLSGVIGVQPGTAKLVPGGVEAESRRVMDIIKSRLEAEGLGMDRIVRCLVMIDDMAEWPTFNSVYKEYFDGDYPARSAFGADGLALGARVEVECTARR